MTKHEEIIDFLKKLKVFCFFLVPFVLLFIMVNYLFLKEDDVNIISNYMAGACLLSIGSCAIYSGLKELPNNKETKKPIVVTNTPPLEKELAHTLIVKLKNGDLHSLKNSKTIKEFNAIFEEFNSGTKKYILLEYGDGFNKAIVSIIKSEVSTVTILGNIELLILEENGGD